MASSSPKSQPAPAFSSTVRHTKIHRKLLYSTSFQLDATQTAALFDFTRVKEREEVLDLGTVASHAITYEDGTDSVELDQSLAKFGLTIEEDGLCKVGKYYVPPDTSNETDWKKTRMASTIDVDHYNSWLDTGRDKTSAQVGSGVRKNATRVVLQHEITLPAHVAINMDLGEKAVMVYYIEDATGVYRPVRWFGTGERIETLGAPTTNSWNFSVDLENYTTSGLKKRLRNDDYGSAKVTIRDYATGDQQQLVFNRGIRIRIVFPKEKWSESQLKLKEKIEADAFRPYRPQRTRQKCTLM